MAKFLDKKQTVFDIKLTSYGKYLLANGRFKPQYYTFLDDNVIYDSNYAGYPEHQNQINNRIKNETQYLEGLVDFESSDRRVSKIRPYLPLKSLIYKPDQISPQKPNFYYENFIGDAHHNSDGELAPAMKVVTLIGEISSSANKDLVNNFNIPQLNIDAIYSLQTMPYSDSIAPNRNQKYSKLINKTQKFTDDNVVVLEAQELMVYIEELNTDVLNDNFDIEVFEVVPRAVAIEKFEGTRRDRFIRKLFKEEYGTIRDGYMSEEDISINNKFYIDELADKQLSEQAVAHYFNLLVDYEIDEKEACKAASVFNKESYYVDIDFDCEEVVDDEIINVDIYGVVTEPEIC